MYKGWWADFKNLKVDLVKDIDLGSVKYAAWLT
jgi:hypothetical protein